MQSSARVEDVDAFCQICLDKRVEYEHAGVARSLYGALGEAEGSSVCKT